MTRSTAMAVAFAIVATFLIQATAGAVAGANNAPTMAPPSRSSALAVPAASCPGGSTPWGDCLRAKWVPYPSVPRIAADGFQYGTVGTVGPQGQVGASTYTKGTPIETGVAPCLTSGCTTAITSNSFWGNETITLLGNVTISTGTSLTVWNCAVNFSEPSIASNWAYGFKASYNGNAGNLYVEHGSVVSQTSAAARAFYINIGSYQGVLPSVWIQNSTIIQISHNGAQSQPDATTYNSNFGVTFLPYIVPSYFNYSTFIGGGVYNLTLGATTASSNGNIMTEAFHSLILNGTYEGYVQNDSLDRVSWVYVGCTASCGGAQIPGKISHVSFQNVSEATAPLDAMEPSAYFAHDLIYNYNATCGSSVSCISLWSYGNQDVNVQNCSFDHITSSDLYYRTVFGATNAPSNITFLHNSVYDVSDWAGDSDMNVISQQYESYSVDNVQFNSVRLKQPNIGGQVFLMYAGTVDFSNNLMQDYSLPLDYPIGNNTNAFDMYTSYAANAPFIGTNGYNHAPTKWTVTGNWLFNSSGGSALMNGLIGNGYVVSGNTIVNVTSSWAFLVSTGSGSENGVIENESIYGLYNYSLGIGTPIGGAKNITLRSNSICDVDGTSLGDFVYQGNITISNEDAPVQLWNDNGTVQGSPSNLFGYKKMTTEVLIENSTLPELSLRANEVAATQVQRSVLPTDFNITVDNSYVPATVLLQSHEFSINYRGPAWDSVSHSNPSFLNLTGYLGIYEGQTYYINSSNIKSESSLPIRLYNTSAQIASVSQAGGNGRLYVLNITSPSVVEAGANSTRAAPMTLSLKGSPLTTYQLTMTDTIGGAVTRTSVQSNAIGVVNVTYDPATMPALALFSLGGFSSGPPPCGGASSCPPSNGTGVSAPGGFAWPAFSFGIWTVVAAAVAFVGVVVMFSGPRRFFPGLGIVALGVVIVMVSGTL